MLASARWLTVLAALLLTQGSALADNHFFASADAARELVHLLDDKGITAVAAVDPAEPGRFIAALYFTGSQLLVVSARHPSVDGVTHRINMGQYREAYLDLQGTPVPEGKVFIQDSGADGILAALPGSGAVDVLYEDGVRQTLFNGDTEGQKLTPSEYEARLELADTSYARLLKALINVVRQPESSVSE